MLRSNEGGYKSQFPSFYTYSCTANVITHINIDCVSYVVKQKKNVRKVSVTTANNISTVLPKVTLPASVIRTLPGYKVSCSAIGTPPIYIAMIQKRTVLVNDTYIPSIPVYEEGNYTCVATSKHGVDVKDFSVIFNGEHSCIVKPALSVNFSYGL